MVNNFTHLWVQSHYSLLGGTAGVEALAQRAAADQLSHLALTDHNGLYGAVAFARACRAVDVQPLIGMSVNVAAPLNEAVPYPEAPGRLVLLATGPAGYRSLCRLSAELQGSPEREKRLAYGLTWDALKEHSRGLICLSGGRLGWLERYLRAGNPVAAGRYVGRLGGLYGDNCFLSLEIHQPEDEVVARETVQLAGRFGLAAVVAQPVYTLTAAERPCLHLLAAIDHNCRLADVPPTALPAWGDPDTDWHWLSPAEIASRYAAFPEPWTRWGKSRPAVNRPCPTAVASGRSWIYRPARRRKLPCSSWPQRACRRGMARQRNRHRAASTARIDGHQRAGLRASLSGRGRYCALMLAKRPCPSARGAAWPIRWWPTAPASAAWTPSPTTSSLNASSTRPAPIRRTSTSTFAAVAETKFWPTCGTNMAQNRWLW
jgi:hypothetical protein